MEQAKNKPHKVRTYPAYAVGVPIPFSEEIIQIRPNPEAPAGMAIFETYNNAKWFVDHLGMNEQQIFPVTVVRSDGVVIKKPVSKP